jgi:diguanylate cyclase (GGDEF)-like protein/hemerythrin-like metal-binding protein
VDAFQWDDCFVTGVAMVDDQHHQLVDAMNRFGEVVMQAAQPTRAELDEVFDKMVDYARYHFHEEEAMMQATGLDARHVKHHCSDHAHFLQNVARMHAATVDADHAGAGRLLTYLTNWLAYHILGTDQTMALLVSAVEQGKSQHEAYLTAHHARDPATAILLRSMTTLFNQVTDSNRALMEVNQTLEARVADRTSDLVAMNQQLESLALTDVLTGLPNRRHALQCLAQFWQQSSQNQTALTCMMIDADGFKAINDSHGHEAGDGVLRQLARRLRNSVRNDDVVCRLGGDEFLILCDQTTLAGGMITAEKLRQEVAEMSVSVGAGIWQGSVSVGVAERTKSLLVFDDLLKLADQAVYLAKKNGRNCIATVQNI